MTKKHSDAETSKSEEQVKKLEKAKTEDALLASEEKYQSLIESSDDPIYLVDRELKYLYANKKLLSRYGKSLSEVTGQNYVKFHSPEATKLFSNRVKEVLKSGKPVAYEYKSQRDGKDFLRTLNPFINRSTGEITAITVISKDITIQKQSEERIKHLNRVLLAVRNVNQLITKENNRDSLIEKACNLLVETRGYSEVWIAILDKKGKITKYANAGDSEYILKISKILKSGKIPQCGLEALKHSKITIIKPGQSTCSECPVFDYDVDKGVVTIPLKYENKIYGITAATVPAELVTDEEEQSLFTEVTGDIAFALWKIEMEEEQHKLEEIESSILHSVPFAVIGLHERQITFANKSVKDIFGWEAAELIGKKARILYRSDEEYAKIADLFYPVLEKQQTHSEEFPCRRKDGKDIICMVSAARIGTSLREREIVVTYADITERKQMEEKLQFERAQLLSVFDSINEIIYITDPETNEILYVNKTLKNAFKKDPVGGVCYKEFQGFESPCEFCTNEIILKEKGKPYEWEYHNPVLGRDYLIVDKIIKWPDGRDVRFELARDITERKRAEKEVRESEEKYRTLFEETPIGILTCDTKGIIQNINMTALKILGSPSEDATKQINLLTFHLLKEAGISDDVRRCIEEGCIVSSEKLYTTKWGKSLIIQSKIIPITDEKGKVNGVLYAFDDISERKRAEEALRDSEENFKNIFHFVPESLLAVNDKTEVLNSNKAFEKLISRYAPQLNMSENELRKKIISELRKRFGKTKHGLIEIRKTAEK